MKPHLLRIILPVRRSPIVRNYLPRLSRGFYSARTLAAPVGESGRTAGKHYTSNVVNRIQMVNHILLRLTLCANRGGVSPSVRLPAAGIQAPAAFVRSMVDAALYQEMERQLLLMARGENIADNQRRRLALGRYLGRKPTRVIQNFYAVQMQALAGETRDSSLHREPEYPDIITERNVTVNQLNYEQHTMKEVRSDSATEPLPPQDASRIADQVMSRIEKRMRLQRDRNGFR